MTTMAEQVSEAQAERAGGAAKMLLSVGGVLAALGASSCCVIPFALFTLGVGGAWIGNLTALAPYQPIFVAVALACLAAAVLLAAGSAVAAERSVTLAGDNMTCETCRPIVRKSLARLPGVTKAEVSAEVHRAVITFDGAKTSFAALVDATKAGFPSRPVQ